MLKNGAYYNRNDFVKHITTITFGRYAFDGSPVSFIEVAEYLQLTPDALRMRKKDAKVLKLLEETHIKVKKIKGFNYFYVNL